MFLKKYHKLKYSALVLVKFEFTALLAEIDLDYGMKLIYGRILKANLS